MENYLKILWFDDRYKESSLMIENAKTMFNVNIIPFEFTNDGVNEFLNNPEKYDAIILDAKSKDSINEVDTTDPLYRAIKILDQNSTQHPVPFVVYTGQPDLMSNRNFESTLPSVKVFKKPGEYEKMMNFLISEIAKKPETKIKNRYKRVFEVCNDKYIGTYSEKDLLSILLKIENEFIFQNPEAFYNSLRKVVEDLLKAFNKLGFLPDCFVERSIAMNESSRFLSGEWVKERLQTKTPFPDIVLTMIKQVIQVCQSASHRSDLDAFIRSNNTPYLFFSVTYQLLDILIWFKSFVDQNPDKETNEKNWRQFKGEGIVNKDSTGNFHVEGVLLSSGTVEYNKLKVGVRVRLVSIEKYGNKMRPQYLHLCRNAQQI